MISNDYEMWVYSGKRKDLKSQQMQSHSHQICLILLVAISSCWTKWKGHYGEYVLAADASVEYINIT